LFGVVGLVGLVGVAQAEKPKHPEHPAKTDRGSCAPRAKGYNAVGTLVSASLSPTVGHERFAGRITIDVIRVNHKSATGMATFTLHDARVVFHHGVDATAPAVGSRVEVHGKITVVEKGCAATGVSPTITVHRVEIGTAKLGMAKK
jgi:hypothetical protein